MAGATAASPLQVYFQISALIGIAFGVCLCVYLNYRDWKKRNARRERRRASRRRQRS